MNKLFLLAIVALSASIPLKAQETDSSFVEDSLLRCQAMYWYYYNDSIRSRSETYPYNFHDVSIGDVISRKWDFGDGQTSEVKNPMNFYDHRYDTVMICLSIVTRDGCTSEFCSQLVVGSGAYIPPQDTVPPDTFPVCKTYWQVYPNLFTNPDIRFGGDIIVPPRPGLYYFQDMSPGPKIKWYWDFDDGTSSTEQNPLHSFADAGFHTVCLTTETPDHCTSMYCDSVYGGTQPRCSLTGTVEDYTGLDGCGLMIVLDNGTVLEPVVVVPNFILRDGQRVRLSYTELADAVSICMAGKIVRIDCIEELYTPPPPSLCNNLIRLSTDVILNGQACNGSASVSLVSPTGWEVPGVNFVWSTGETGPSVYNLCPGVIYSVIAEDTSGCAVSGSFSYGSSAFIPDSLIGFWNYEQDNLSFIFNIPVFSDNVKCIWDFGDGETADGNSVSHTYSRSDNYTVDLLIYDNSGNLLYTQQIPVTTGSPTGLNDRKHDEPVVYPVPVSGTLYIRPGSNFRDVSRIEIVNANGQVVNLRIFEEHSAESTVEMDVSSLNPGIYMGRLIFGNGTQSRFRFVK